MHTAGQFKLLQHRIETVLNTVQKGSALKLLNEKEGQEIYEEMRKCIMLHQELIWYSNKMKYIFNYTTLCQLLVSSIMLCVAGFQVFLVSIFTILRILLYRRALV